MCQLIYDKGPRLSSNHELPAQTMAGPMRSGMGEYDAAMAQALDGGRRRLIYLAWPIRVGRMLKC